MGLFSWLSEKKRRKQGERDLEAADRRRAAEADTDLEQFFTDAEEARRRFDELIGADALPKRIVVVHGVGAVGKSSLLQMFRLACRRDRVAVALAGGEEVASIVDLLERWSADLKDDKVALPALNDRLERYRRLQLKVEEEAHRAGAGKSGEAGDKLAKAGGAGAGVAVGLIPVVGPLVKDISADAAEALINILRTKLSREEFEFFRDPTEPLTDDFLIDLTGVAGRRRVVLMLDTFEQVAGLSAWLCGLVQRLPDDILVVIAGRVIPEWDSEWPTWIARAELLELREMRPDDVRRLVRQYSTVTGLTLSDEQVEQIVAFARGLPMAATTAARLLAMHQATGAPATDPRVVAQLAELVLRGVPAESRAAFEAAAVLRAFNADSLHALLGSDAQSLYDELRRWPFTRPRRGGLAIHDTMREVMNEALRARSPQTFSDLNARAAAFYEALVAKSGGEERERLQLEWLYHLTRADEAAGVKAFRTMAEELVRYKWPSRLRALVNDVAGYPLDQDDSRLWLRYYQARLSDIEGFTRTAEETYREIGDREGADPILRAYALCDLGALLATLDRLSEPGGENRAVQVVQQSLRLAPALDTKLIANHITLMNVTNTRAAWDESIEHLRPVRDFARANDDTYGLIMAERLQAAIYGLQGDWPRYLESRQRCLQAVDQLGDVPSLKMQVAYFTWPLVFMGRCREAQESSERALRCAERLEERELMITIIESIALALGMQGLTAAADERFTQAMNFFENFNVRERPDAGNPDRHIRALLSFRGLVSLRAGRLDAAEADLARALAVKAAIGDRIGTPEVHAWMGQLHERRHSWADAAASYQSVLDLSAVCRKSFEAQALAGLVRVGLAQGATDAVADHLASAEALANRYRYSDVLASLRLTQGHSAWNGAVAAWPSGREAVESAYRSALLHGLAFNRFLLDETLGAINAACQARGDEGRQLLESLLAWWQTGSDAGASLVEAERQARGREPADGAAQTPVAEGLQVALATMR